MHIIRSAVAMLGLLLLAPGTAVAQNPPQVTHYRLDNGLEVLLAPDNRVPKVGVALVYRVGGMNEPAGRSGFAHLFEHLMFTGTAAYPRIDDTYSALGISHNAFTADDRTAYLADAPASALPVLLSVEADRMANLGGAVDERELRRERDVVKNEMRQTFLDSPGAPAVQELRSSLFPAPHPYAEAVIGSVADLDAAELPDVAAFFNAYYVPNNAILGIAGDFDVETVRAQIAATFGSIPRGAHAGLPEASVPEPVKLRLRLSDRVPAPFILLATAGPPVDSRDSAALLVASDLLGNYEYGLLRHALINTGLAIGAGASWEPRRLAGTFMVSASAAPGVAPEALEAALREAVASFAASELQVEDIERSRRHLRLGWRLGTESMLSRAEALAVRFDLFGARLANLNEDPLLLSLSVDDVEAAVRRLIAADAMSALTVVPGGRPAYPSVLTESSGVAKPLVVASRPTVEVPALAPGDPSKSELPPMETDVLSNGIRLVHYRLEAAPLAFLAASVVGGTSSDQPGKEGLMTLTAALMSRGAADMDFEAFSKAAKDIGADISGQADRQNTVMVLAAMPEEFSASVRLLADSVLRPRFEPAEWEALRAEMLQSLAYQATDPSSLAYRALAEQVFPPQLDQPALQPTLESVTALTIGDVRDLHQRLFTPHAMTIYSVGPLALAAVKAELEQAFGGWESDSPGLTPRPHPPASFAPGMKVRVVPSEGDSQAVIYLARPAPGFKDPHLMESIAVARLLGGDAGSRLNQVLRETKGYTYGTSTQVPIVIPTGGMLLLNAAVEAGKLGESLLDIFAGFEGLATVPLSRSELARTVMATVSAQAGAAETSRGLFNVVNAAAGIGLTAAEFHGRLDEIVGLELPAVQEQARALSSLKVAVLVIAGDPAVILPQLEEIGVTAVEVVPPTP